MEAWTKGLVMEESEVGGAGTYLEGVGRVWG